MSGSRDAYMNEREPTNVVFTCEWKQALHVSRSKLHICERKQASHMSRNPSYSQKFVLKNVQSCVPTNVVFFWQEIELWWNTCWCICHNLKKTYTLFAKYSCKEKKNNLLSKTSHKLRRYRLPSCFHCITCYIALHITLHYMLQCIAFYFAMLHVT